MCVEPTRSILPEPILPESIHARSILSGPIRAGTVLVGSDSVRTIHDAPSADHVDDGITAYVFGERHFSPSCSAPRSARATGQFQSCAARSYAQLDRFTRRRKSAHDDWFRIAARTAP